MINDHLKNQPAIDDISLLPHDERYAVFLSASIRINGDASEYIPADRPMINAENELYAATLRPDLIRAAVSALTRVALGHGMRLVFGAHPTITPMVLQAAKDVGAAPGSVLIFNSEVHKAGWETLTLRLAEWTAGQIVWTAAQPELPTHTASAGLKQRHRFPKSLERMRELMVSPPRIIGGVFIGGLGGVAREAQLFRHLRPGLKCYAIESTGGAALMLGQGDPTEFHGTLSDARALQSMSSYTVVARKIVHDMLPPGVAGP
jgi:hypothetical protein